jgi:DHA1 family multidrug resistance protein-like MFS transporter
MDYRKALLIFLSLTLLINISDRLIFIIVPMWLLERSFSATEIGTIFSAAAITMMFVRFLTSKLSDRWGRKRIMVIGLFTSAVSTALYPFASRIHDYAVIKSFHEAGYNLHNSVRNAMVGDTFKGKQRTRVLSILGTAFPLGRACAAILGIIITTFLSVVYGFYAAAISVFIAFFIILVFYKDTGFVKSERKIIGIHGATRSIMLISTISLFSVLNYAVAYTPAFFVLSRSLGFTENSLFYYFLLAYIISAFFAYRTGSWIKSHGKESMVAITMISTGVFSALYAFANSPAILVICLTGIAVSFYVYNISYNNVLLDLTSDDRRGEQIGISKLMSGMGMIVGPLLGGLLVDTVSLQWTFMTSGFLSVVGALFALLLKRYG